MDLLRAFILGVVQGVTEFLPISSDGHLVVVDRFLPGGLLGKDALGFDILLHAGSLLAIIVGFRDVWWKILRGLFARDMNAWKTFLFVIFATVPAVISGLFLEDIIANDLRTLTAASVGFLVTAGCLILGETVGRFRRDRERVTFVDSILIGVAQAAAVLPGVSRSGLTVAMARGLGLQRPTAFDFSFLLALPIIGGAVAKTLVDASRGGIVFPPLSESLVGFAASLVISFIAILFLRQFVRSYSFSWFAWYLIPLALLLLGEEFGIRTMLDAPHARDAVTSVGAVAVFFFALVEVVPPFSFISPGISALVIAGSIAPDLWSLLTFAVAAIVASLLGNVALFYAGRVFGPTLVKALRIPPAERERGEMFVRKAGIWAILVGQFVSALRPTVSFAAGMLGMHPAWFFGSALVAAILWGGSAVGAGYLLQGDVAIVLSVLAFLGLFTVIGVAAFAFFEWIKAQRQK